MSNEAKDTLGHRMVWVMIVGSASCVTQVVDMRAPGQEPHGGDTECGPRERFDPKTGSCSACEYKTPNPSPWVCPCGHEYHPGPLPYCDTPDAYYECLPCAEGLESCEAYDPSTSTSSDCDLMTLCCDDRAETDSSCCPADTQLWCVLGEAGRYTVGCLPEPCCEGDECVPGSSDCEPWQTCDQGRCTPGCEPGAEECVAISVQGALTCVCDLVGSPP